MHPTHPAHWHLVAILTLLVWGLVFRMRVHWRSHFAMFVVLAAATTLFSWSVILDPGRGIIVGTVLNSTTKKPIYNARVYYPQGDAWVRTDREGRFRMPGVTIGNDLRVTARARGYESSYDSVTIEEGKVTESTFSMTPRPPSFTMHNYDRVFRPAEEARINVAGNQIEKLSVRLYAADAERDREEVRLASNERHDWLGARFAKEQPIYETEYTPTPDEDGDFNGTVKIPPQKPGLYVVRATVKGGKEVRSSWYLVTDLALITRRSPGQMLIYAQQFSTGQPLAGVHVRFFTDMNKLARPYHEVVTGPDGTVMWNKPGFDNMSLVADWQGQYAYSRSDQVSTYRRRDGRIYLYTERPIYRPGHEVFFRGIVRGYRDRKLSLPTEPRTVSVHINDDHGQKIYSRDLPVDEFGCFYGEMALGSSAGLGDYALNATWNGIDSNFSFKVAEYRKPEYKVDLTPLKPRYTSGEAVDVKVNARYFFGAPVTTAKVNYTVFESYYRYDRMRFVNFSTGGDTPEEYGGMTASGALKLDNEGNAILHFAPGKSDHDRDFYVEVEVEDPSHRKVTSSADVLVTMGAFYIDASTDRWGYEPNDTVPVTVRTQGYDDKPQGTVTVKASLEQNTWHEVVDKKTGVSHYEVTTATPWSGAVTTDAKGEATLSLHPPADGSYVLHLQARDTMGNDVRSNCWFYVSSGRSDSAFSPRDLTLMLDKNSYRVGGTANVVVSVARPGTSVLLCVDGKRIHQYQVVKVNGSSATVPIKVAAEYMPNVDISAVAIKDKQLVTDNKPLSVDTGSQKLKIHIVTDKPRYEPGQSMGCDIVVTDQQGRPVRAELSLGVVDMAIYSIAPDIAGSIFDAFYGAQSSEVTTEYSFAPDYSGGRNKEDDMRVRHNFKDTAFWQPALRTDDAGRAHVKFALPDNLTTWRLTVRGVTRDTLVGEATADVVSRKPLLVRLEVPRFMTEHDSMELSAVVHNDTGRDQDVNASIELGGLKLQGEAGQKFHIANGSSHRFAWTALAEHTGTARATVRAAGDGAGDAMQLEFPVLAHGTEQVSAASGLADPSGTLKLDMPTGADPADAKLTVYLTPSVATVALQSLDYLATYPHGCVEQTMSSFLPDMQVARALRDLHLDASGHEKVIDELPAMAKTGLERLYALQHEDGGWGWWTDDATHPYMTAYAVYGLHEAQRSGFAVRQQAYDRGVTALENLLKTNVSEFKDFSGEVAQRTRWNGRAYMVWVLCEVGKKPLAEAQEVAQHQKDMNPYTRALLAMSLWRLGDPDQARQIMTSLQSDADETDTTCHWNTRTFDYSWVDNPVEATAYVLRALVMIDPHNPRVEKTIRWLVNYRRGPLWTCTKDTGAVIGTIVDYLEANPHELAPHYMAHVRVNGHTLHDVPVDSVVLGPTGVIDVPSSLLARGKNEVTVERDGSGTLYFSAQLRSYPDIENASAEDHGFKLERSYSLVTTDKGKEKVTPIAAGTQVPLGARVRVNVKVTTKKPYGYVMIEDELIPGCEVAIPEGERNLSGYWYIGREIHDARFCIFITDLYFGSQELTYDVFTEAPGHYHVRPAEAYMMYTPEVRGTSAESHFDIAPEQPGQ